MKKREPFSEEALEHDKRVSKALEAAHKLPSGPKRIDALKKAAQLAATRKRIRIQVSLDRRSRRRDAAGTAKMKRARLATGLSMIAKN